MWTSVLIFDAGLKALEHGKGVKLVGRLTGALVVKHEVKLHPLIRSE